MKSKCIVDYNFTGKCVIRDCLKAESIASLNLEASKGPLDDWIGIFNHEDKEKDGTDKKERSMHKASPLGNDIMKEVLISLSRRQCSWPLTLSHKVQVHEMAKKHRIIHPDAELGLSRGGTFLRSLSGCEVQPKHADFAALSVMYSEENSEAIREALQLHYCTEKWNHVAFLLWTREDRRNCHFK